MLKGDKMNLNNQFDLFNKRYFNNKLKKIPVFIKKMNDAYGLYNYDKNILIDTGLNQNQRKNILLHEMCHHAVHTLDGNDYHHHGVKWKERMRSCGFTGRIDKFAALVKRN